MHSFRTVFTERVVEIDAYLDFLEMLETEVQNGVPRLGSGPQNSITGIQQKVLYSSVYLQIYNVVESTITQCLEALCSEIIRRQTKPKDLSLEIQREWVRFSARTHTDLNFENKLKATLELCEILVSNKNIDSLEIEKGGGGNWDDNEIEAIIRRLGFSISINPQVFSSIKRPFRNGQNPMAYIRTLRNDLAHGTVSFAECGADVTTSDLRNLRDITTNYLEEIVSLFENAIQEDAFLSLN